MGDQIHCGHHWDHVAVDLLPPDLSTVNPEEDSISGLHSRLTATPRWPPRKGGGREAENFGVGGAWTGEAPSLLIVQNLVVAQTAASENCADLKVEQEKVEEGEDASEEHPGPVIVEEDVARREPQLRWLPVHQI